jgi:replicative DNA helicase Mcm
MRGDIHILLVGDPGVAKSVMLSFIAGVAPKARYVSGKSATGAGLTATVVKDEILKGWSLEAGAMVLANKGLVCIDEFDKMDDEDRSTMHEAMEQQCYLPNFKLLFSDGSKTEMGNFVDNLMKKQKEDIVLGNDCEILPLKENIKLLTTNFEKIYPIRIENVSRHKAPRYLTKISLNNGREITVTPNHPCWTVEDGQIKTTPAEKLKKGDFFPIPAELPIEYCGADETLCKILGYHITDGCYELNRGKKTGIQFWNNDADLIADYKNSVEKYFNIKAGVTKRNNQYAVRVISAKVVEFLNNLDKNLLEKCKIKKIPEKIMQYDKKSISLLLKSMFDGDGSVIHVKRNGCRINFVSENRELAEQVAELLLRFGISSSIYIDKNVYRVDICGEENLKKFGENIGFVSKKKENRLKDYLSRKKTIRSNTDIIPNSSKTIDKIFNVLRINKNKYLPSQISTKHNKNRINLGKLIEIAEKRIKDIKKGINEIESAQETLSIKKIKENLEVSSMSIYKKLGLSSYQFSKFEKDKDSLCKYKNIMKSELISMLKIEEKISNLKKLTNGMIRWSKIKSVETVNNEDIPYVYDVTINPTHSFISNGMILHNSVTISKATVQATLRAQTSVLAAANPKFGRFDPTQSIPKQVNLAPSLLSRFDAIFIMRDIPNKKTDESIAIHVLKEHKQETKHDAIEKEILKKYISYSKQKFNPVLTDEAIEEMKHFYVNLRNQPIVGGGISKPIPIGARQLEALVRLAEAHARMRLSNEVKKIDAKAAIDLVNSYLLQVGYDDETKSFDIDKISGNSASQRGKIAIVRETIENLEKRLGKLIPLEELEKELKDKIKIEEIDEAVGKLLKSGDLFRPKKGYIQRM